MPPRKGRRTPRYTTAILAVLALTGAAAAQPRMTFETGTLWNPTGLLQPTHLAAGDFDEDGRRDLAVSDAAADLTAILLGTGVGTFTPATAVLFPSRPSELAVDDFDRDGHDDIAALVGAGSESRIEIRFGNGTGRFSDSATVAFPSVFAGRFVAADLDRDGDPDLVATIPAADAIHVVENRGGRLFGTPVPFPAGDLPSRIAAAHLDLDGKIDLVALNADALGRGVLSVCRGNGTLAPAAPVPVSVPAGPAQFALAELSGDGRIDLALTHPNLDRVAVLDGDGAGGFGNERFLPRAIVGPGAIAVGDLSGDGRNDVLAAHFAGYDPIAAFTGDGAGGFAATGDLFAGSDPVEFLVEDVSGDGLPDLIVACQHEHEIAILLGPDHGGAPAFAAGGGSAASLALADFDEDGRLDAAVAKNDSDGNGLAILAGDGSGSFEFASAIPAGGPNVGIVSADFDVDGHADVALVRGSLGVATILLGDGMGGFSTRASVPVGREPRRIVVDDFNGDSAPDLAVACPGRGCVDFQTCFDEATVSILLGDGTGGFVEMPPLFEAQRSVDWVVPGDFNEDGNPDLAVEWSAMGTIVYFGDGSGRFTVATLATSATNVVAMVANRYDADAHLDLAVVEAFPGELSRLRILFGRGDGTFRTGPNRVVPEAARAAAAGDFDGDGDTDLAIAFRQNLSLANATGIYANDGAGGLVPAGYFGAGLIPSAVAVTDADRDGQEDVLVLTSGTDPLVVLLNRTITHLACRRGQVDARAGGPADVLFVNGSAGTGPDRAVELGTDSPLEIALSAPPSRPAGPSGFLLGAWRGNPGPDDWTPLPFGLGTSCAETPLTAASPRRLLAWWNNVGKPGVLGAPTRPSSPAPAVVASLPAAGREITFFVQGILRDRNAPNGRAAVTNGVLVTVRGR